MKLRYIHTALFVVGAVFINAQVKIQPHVYIGAGFVRPITQRNLDFQIEEEFEKNYLIVNESNAEKATKMHAQARLGLIEMGPLSAGYTFWGYRREYETDYPNYWALELKQYPLRYDYSLHACYVQLDIATLRIQRLRATPYLMAGAGQYYGSSKSIAYSMAAIDEGYILYREAESAKYNGWAWMAGFGYVVLKRAYIQFEIVDFRDKTLPAQRFFDMVIGVRI